MKLAKSKCSRCGKSIYRSRGRFNESRKFGWKVYCSSLCQTKAFSTRQLLGCSNINCPNKFFKTPKAIQKVEWNYCSRSCAATVNNHRFPKRKKEFIKNICKICGNIFFRKGLFCSLRCKFQGQFVGKERIIKLIADFYKKNQRIPFKKEFEHSKAARERFGSWNNAIRAAGFYPNPVMFANKYIARDGHKCDSLTEKIIDDWLVMNKISHQRGVPYPGDSKFTCDFVIKKYFIEFFGLENEHKEYTEIVKKKRKLASRYNIKLIEIKPSHIFPKNRLNQELLFLLK